MRRSLEKVHNIQIMEPVFRSRFAHSCSLFRLIFDPILDQFGSVNYWDQFNPIFVSFWIEFVEDFALL